MNLFWRFRLCLVIIFILKSNPLNIHNNLIMVGGPVGKEHKHGWAGADPMLTL